MKKLILSLLVLTGFFDLNAMEERNPSTNEELKSVVTHLRETDDSARTCVLIQNLIENGADINAHDDQGNSLLMQMIKDGNYCAVETLIRCGADVNWVNQTIERENPVFWAIKYDQPDILKLLIDHNADIQSEREGDYDTPLTYALYHKKFDIARLLIHRGAFLYGNDDNGDAPLISAILHKQTDIVELLIEKGVDINEPDHLGNTPLMYAADAPSLEIVQLLVNHNANLNAQSSDIYFSATVTEFASGILHCEERATNPYYRLKEYLKTQDERIAILSWLFDAKHLPVDTPRANRTALSCAVEVGFKHITEFLIERGANINAVDPFDVSVWHNALKYDQNSKIINFLIKKGITYDARTSLINAAAHGYRKIAKVLLDHNAPLLERNAQGDLEAPALFAAIRGFSSMRTLHVLLDHVEKLLRNGKADAVAVDTILTNALNSLQFSLYRDRRLQGNEIARFHYAFEEFYRLLCRNPHLLPRLRHACLIFPTQTTFSGRAERGFGNAVIIELGRTSFQKILRMSNFRKMISTIRKNILR